MSVYRYGQLYLHCSLSTSGSFQLFLHSDHFEGEIIPFSGVCQSGRLALSTPEAVVASRTDRRPRRKLTTTSGNIITQSIIFSFSIS